MKEKKQGGNTRGPGHPGGPGGQTDKEEEKNALEKLEDEFKGTLFNVFYVLLKDDETSHWKHILQILLDFIQIYYYSFASTMGFPWKSDTVLNYLQTFLEFFHVQTWLDRLDMTAYLVLFYICVAIVCLVILDVFYVSYSFSKKKFAFVWPMQALRSIFVLFVTELYLPFLETFTTMLRCQDGNMTLFPDIDCWAGEHIIHSVFAIVISIIFIIIAFVVSLTYYESRATSNDLAAKVTARADVFIVIMKTILLYLFAFLNQVQYHWFIIAVLIVLSFIAYFNYRSNWPYFNDKMNIFFCALTGLFLWANLVLFLAKLLEDTDFSGALQLYFLGLPLVIGLVVFDRDDRVQLLLQNINNFQRGEDVAHQIRYFLHILQNGKDGNSGSLNGINGGGSGGSGSGSGAGGGDRKNAIILKGYVYHHEDNCPNQDCQLKQYKNSIIQSVKNKKGAGSSSQKRHNQQKENTDNHQLLLSHARNMYRSGIQKFPTSTGLKIQYAFFLMDRMNKKTEALAELQQAAALNPPFDEQFLIYRYQKISEDFGDGSGGDGHGSGGMDLVAKFAYEQSLRQCAQHIQKSAALHLEFWNYLREDRPDISKLNDCGSKINQSIVIIESYWNQLQKLNSNVPRALKLYAKFLIEILNDKEGGQDLLSRAKDAANIKQNYFDANNMHDDMNDISAMSTNGTPCIYVTGESDKIGMITQCNAGACRIMGYTMNEIKNHNVEKLMPEMYAKNHSRILDDALAKGAENIPNKERLVFARHKSGYIFPVWIQLKMLQSSQLGTQFVALFKIDKKIMSSNIGFVLINKEKKIQGISAGCLKVVNLDIQKMKRLAANGIDIDKLTPGLLDEKNESNYNQKVFQPIDWNIPDFTGGKRKVVTRGGPGGKNGSNMYENPTNRKIVMSGNKLRLNCQVSSINMGELQDIGWYLRLEQIQDKRGDGDRRPREKERVKQPLFQFRYDSISGKFIREIKDSLSIDNANKDPNFINGQFTIPDDGHQAQYDPAKISPVKGDDTTPDGEAKGPSAQGSVGDQEEKVGSVDVSQNNVSQYEDIFEKKRRWGKNIAIYRLQGGVFKPKELDDELKKQKELEEERKKKLEEEERSSQNSDVFKNNIKSRKALQLAINDKSTPPAIRNLRMTMNLVVLALLALAITEYTIISSQFKDINENFNLIQQSYGRVSEVQRIAYDVRTLIMINENRQTTYKNYTTQTDFVDFMKKDIESALNNLYDLQNSISLTSLSMSSQQLFLTDTKSVNLYFKENDSTLKVLKFSLTEAVLQISSAVFTARHLNISAYQENQEDIYFITYNVFNEFLVSLRQSSSYFVEDLHQRTVQKNELILILFLSSLGTMVITMAILCPVVSTVNMARLKVLSLFVDIPNHHVIALSNKCERFLSSFNDSEHNDDKDTNETDSLKVDDSDVTLMGQSKRTGHKQPKNSQGSNKKVFIQFGVGVLFVMAYFVVMFVLSVRYINNIQIITKEMNVLAQAESYYSFAQNVQREMIYNRDKPILNDISFNVAKDTIEQLYSLNQLILEDHFHNRDILTDEYKDLFRSLYQDNLCNKQDTIKLNLIPFTCSTFLSSTATQGLQSVLMRYFETLKETLKIYVNYMDNNWSPINLINNDQFLEMYIIQFRFIQDSFRSFVASLKDATNGAFQSIIDTRMAAFIIFIIALGLAYLILWTPFVNNLNREIWRTKSMLTIIPIEVILKIPRIQEFLHSQSFFQSKASSSTSS